MTVATMDDSFDPVEPDETVDAREYVRTIWHDKWRILGLAVLLSFVFGIAGVTVVHPRFRTTAVVALDPVALAQLLDTTGQARDAQADLAAEASVTDDSTLRQQLEDELDFTWSGSSRPTEGSLGALTFDASSDSAAHSAQALDALVNAYIAKRIALGTQLVDDQINPLKDNRAQLQAQRDEAAQPLEDIQAQLNDNPSPSYQATLLQQQANLQNQLGDTLNGFDDQIAQASSTIQRLEGIKDDIASGGNSQITHGPTTTQTTPGATRLAAIGFVLGLLVGFLISVARRALDKSVRSKATLEHATGHRVIGIIPRVVDWDQYDEQVQNVSLTHPKSPPAEAYRTLRTSLRFLTVDQAVHRILITSSVEGEGKTTTVANLGVTLARTGRRVLLVDADLRKPRLHEFFGLEASAGLSEALQGAEVAPLVRQVDALEGLFVLPAGAPPTDPSERLESERATEVLRQLDAMADLLIIDAPPVLPVTDALVLATQADGVLLVAKAGSTQPKEAGRATELLVQVGAPFVGSVLNSVSRDMGEGYAFEYSYVLDERPRRKAAEDDVEEPDEGDPDAGEVLDPAGTSGTKPAI